MAHHGFNQMGSGGSIDPNDLSMGGTFNNQSYQNNFNSNSNTTGYTSGSALFGDDELLDGLGSPTEAPQGIQGMSDMTMGGFTQSIYSNQSGLPMDQAQVNGYSNTPEGDPIQSPFVHNLNQYRQMQHPQAFGSIQSPGSFAGSPLANGEFNEGNEQSYLNARTRMAATMQRKASSTRSPMQKNSRMNAIHVGSAESYGAQPIRANGHEKTQSGQWMHTPNSISSFAGSGFSSPLQANLHSAQINEMMLKTGGASMPAKLSSAPMTSTQEAKKKRRRESHNLVERRRRDNINERIQDLSKLVPAHRLEDEKIKKLIQSGTPLSPTLTGISHPGQATSGLAGPGAKRATSGTTGNITTGLPIEEKDKGPNKGDILNGAVSWTRDLMWLLNRYISRQEDIMNVLVEHNIPIPFEITEDEMRLTSELINTMHRADVSDAERHFSYSRRDGTGLRVPDHTDYKGARLDGSGGHAVGTSTSPDDNNGINEFVEGGEFWDDDGSGDLDLKGDPEDDPMEFN